MHARAIYLYYLDEIDAFSLRAFIRLHNEDGIVRRPRRLNDDLLLSLQQLLLLIAALCYGMDRPARRLRRRLLSHGVAELDELLWQKPRTWVKAELVRKQAAKKVERPAERDFAD